MILDNPFHVLGLPADCTPKELTSRQAQTAAFLRVGRKLDFEDDIFFRGGSRNASTVEIANRELQDAARRVQHGLFWFTRTGAPDRHGLSHLAQGRPREAFWIFERLEDREPLSRGSISTLNNFGSLCLTLGVIGTWELGRARMTEEERCGLIVRGLKAKARVLGASPPAALESYVASVGDGMIARDLPAVIQRFGESLKDTLAELDRHGVDCAIPRIVDALKAGGPRLDDVTRPLTQEALRKIEELIRKCRGARQANRASALPAVKQMHEALPDLLREFAATMGTDDPAYAATADRSAEELVEGAVAGIKHHQEADDLSQLKLDIAVEMIARAAAVAIGPRMRTRASDFLGQARKLQRRVALTEAMAAVRDPLFDWQREIGEAREHLQGSKLLDHVKTSVAVASVLLGALRRAGIQHVGPEFEGDELVDAGSMVCSQLVGSLVMAANQASETFGDSIDIHAAHAVMSQIVQLFGGGSRQAASATFPVKSDVHEHMMRNWTIIESLRSGHEDRVTRSGATGTGTGCLIAGLVAAGILVALWANGQSDSVSPGSPPTLAQLEFARPVAGTDRILTAAEIRWCLREDIRIGTLRSLAVSNPQIDRFNGIVSGYNQRCVSFRYNARVLDRAEEEIQGVRTEIISTARRTSTSVLGSPP